MNSKKILALLLALVMVLSFLVACDGDDKKTDNTSNDTNDDATNGGNDDATNGGNDDGNNDDEENNTNDDQQKLLSFAVSPATSRKKDTTYALP